MKRFLYFAVLAFLSSCLNEKNAEPGKPSTFVRYFNGGNNDYASVAEETSDGGIILLGTTRIASVNDSSKIKLIKTDRYGNTLSQLVYPEFGSDIVLAGNALLQLSSSNFIIAATQITASHRDLAIIEAEETDGLLTKKAHQKIDFSASPYFITESVQARAIQLNSNGNYLVLAALQADTYNMLLAEIDKATLKINWVKKYGAGVSTLANRLFIASPVPANALPNVYWSGTVIRNSSDIRLVKAAQNSINTIYDLPIGKPGFKEEGRDICQYGVGFVVVGNSNETGNQDILFKVLTESGAELLSKTISGEEYGDVDTGNAVCSTNGGFVILGTINRAGQDDYFLAKYDGFGTEVWAAPKVFGNTTRNDTGASVRQLSDGSLLILGTTFFGGVNTIMLMRANSNGEIE